MDASPDGWWSSGSTRNRSELPTAIGRSVRSFVATIGIGLPVAVALSAGYAARETYQGALGLGHLFDGGWVAPLYGEFALTSACGPPAVAGALFGAWALETNLGATLRSSVSPGNGASPGERGSLLLATLVLHVPAFVVALAVVDLVTASFAFPRSQIASQLYRADTLAFAGILAVSRGLVAVPVFRLVRASVAYHAYMPFAAAIFASIPVEFLATVIGGAISSVALPGPPGP